MPRFYFDLSAYKSYDEIGQPPYTPAVSIIFALDKALDTILADGMESIFEHHRKIGRFTREGVKKLGLRLFPDESVASDTVTAVSVPDGVDAAGLLAKMRTEHGVVLAGGQQALAGKIFRIGHMGHCTTDEIQGVLDALAVVLPEVGFTG